MYELILALKVAHADTIALVYKLVNYRWNTAEENTDSLRANLLSIAQEVFAAIDLLGEHTRSLTLPDSPNFNNLMGLTTVEIDMEAPPTIAGKIQSLVDANAVVIQTLTTAKILAEGINATASVSMLNDRIAAHQSLATTIPQLIGN